MGRAAVRYAKAILSLAQDKNVTADIQKDMVTIADTVTSSKDLRVVLSSPLVKNEVKLSCLKEIFKGAHTITEGAFATLIDNKRINQLGSVAEEYSKLYNDINNTKLATVTTAVPLDGALKEKVLQKVKELTGNEAAVTNIVDESIIGGFILRVGDLQYNASVEHMLTTLRRELKN
ncbi:ATP synthase F1 subunit delta [Aquimarina brevivitae]|uniref:ATP synthase subunit delta n=1 Tax=Aquimarina brevivitae TaxID=323412 RepID=A0A4Q7PFX3_9FLAO|nr:ATP synthase F1 subunit delta [Aquimarina brevivitae]RZS99255.1 ATP synthase F1 subcomplex delta subunit [Aquimarina brevivitae]